MFKDANKERSKLIINSIHLPKIYSNDKIVRVFGTILDKRESKNKSTNQIVIEVHYPLNENGETNNNLMFFSRRLDKEKNIAWWEPKSEELEVGKKYLFYFRTNYRYIYLDNFVEEKGLEK